MPGAASVSLGAERTGKARHDPPSGDNTFVGQLVRPDRQQPRQVPGAIVGLHPSDCCGVDGCPCRTGKEPGSGFLALLS